MKPTERLSHSLGIVNFEIMRVVLVFSDERLFESVHFGGFAVDEDDVSRFQSFDEFRSLLVVRVGGEGNVLHGTIEF